MEYKVAVNSNPLAALFEELGAINTDSEKDSGTEEAMDTSSETESSDLPSNEQPYSLLVIGALPPHLAEFVLSISYIHLSNN